MSERGGSHHRGRCRGAVEEVRDSWGARGARTGRRDVTRWVFALGLVVSLPVGEVAAGLDPDLARQFEAFGVATYAPGMRPPDFEGVTADGERVSLAGLRGRVVLLNFWASWCLDCRTEMPALDRLHAEFAEDGLVLLGVNVGETPAVVQRFAAEVGVTFPTLMDPRGQVQRAYGVIGVPTSFLIGRDGRGLGLIIGPRAWGSRGARALIRALLEPPGGGR